jgi:hypothetical protein
MVPKAYEDAPNHKTGVLDWIPASWSLPNACPLIASSSSVHSSPCAYCSSAIPTSCHVTPAPYHPLFLPQSSYHLSGPWFQHPLPLFVSPLHPHFLGLYSLLCHAARGGRQGWTPLPGLSHVPYLPWPPRESFPPTDEDMEVSWSYCPISTLIPSLQHSTIIVKATCMPDALLGVGL